MFRFTPPSISYPWQTRDRLTSRLRVARGLCVMSDGLGGWKNEEYPYLGDLLNLVDGTSYFLGGHIYNVTEAVAFSLIAAGYQVDSDGLFPSDDLFPSLTLYPVGA